jgi:dipeptidyl aminopeptidase/acylaminoacyl peptidase
MKKLLFSIVLVLSYFAGYTQENVLDPLDVAKIKQVGSITVSEGNWAAFTVSVQADPLKENKPAHSELHLLNLDTKETTPFITSGSVRSIAFRPGKSSITFLSRRSEDKSTSLYEIPLAGGEAKKIFEFDYSISAYEWAADGMEIAFTATKRMNVESPLPYQPEIYEENLPVRKGFIYSFSSNQVKELDLEHNIFGLHWSPTGDMMTAIIAPTSLVDDSYMKQKFVFVDARSLKISAEVDHAAKLGSYKFSPDGKILAFIAGANINDPVDGRLFTVSTNGGKPQNLLPEFKGKIDDIEWTDNNTLAFLGSEGVLSTLGTINANGGSMKIQLKPGGPVIDAFEITSNGSYLLNVESPVHPHELYSMEKGKSELERITDSNPWLTKFKLARQEVVTYKAKDGVEIQGILIHPLNEKSGQKYPMITVVHGGPESHYDNGWLTSYSMAGQVGAAKDYVVFYPNYRGSTGRGLEFAMSSQADLAGKEFDDIVDGVDYLIKSGLVDESKVGVTGGSYGGYATGWLSTRYTEKFAAGVMNVGISNNISKWGTSDIPEELYLVHARKRIWDDYEFFLKRSPIYYADQAKTPLLILHGKEDTRVYPGQSMELYRHIKTRTDTPVRLVYYPGEGHGNRNSTARLDYNLRMLRWFDNYLKGEDQKLNTSIELESGIEK